MAAAKETRALRPAQEGGTAVPRRSRSHASSPRWAGAAGRTDGAEPRKGAAGGCGQGRGAPHHQARGGRGRLRRDTTTFGEGGLTPRGPKPASGPGKGRFTRAKPDGGPDGGRAGCPRGDPPRLPGRRPSRQSQSQSRSPGATERREGDRGQGDIQGRRAPREELRVKGGGTGQPSFEPPAGDPVFTLGDRGRGCQLRGHGPGQGGGSRGFQLSESPCPGRQTAHLKVSARPGKAARLPSSTRPGYLERPSVHNTPKQHRPRQEAAPPGSRAGPGAPAPRLPALPAPGVAQPRAGRSPRPRTPSTLLVELPSSLVLFPFPKDALGQVANAPICLKQKPCNHPSPPKAPRRVRFWGRTLSLSSLFTLQHEHRFPPPQGNQLAVAMPCFKPQIFVF